MQHTVQAILVGAGQRGTSYASYGVQFPEKFRIVAVAEPLYVKRERIKKWFNITDNRVFSTWKDLAKLGKIADCAIICTQDAMHREPAVEFARMGYHLLLEKPMAPTKEDCIAITHACESAGVMLAICHVLRYFPPVITIKNLIQSGIIGEVAHIQHTENVGFYHFAHSFVRGNWRNSMESSFAFLSKCCHDVDLICYWMGNKKCLKVSSVGSLFHFRNDKKPAGASSRCLDCSVETSCPYSAKKIYLAPLLCCNAPTSGSLVRWPARVVLDGEGMTIEEYKVQLKEQLKVGPYGRCVYECDNDVCDNQTANFEFDDGSTATVTMVAFTQKLCERVTTVFGSLGQISWNGEASGPVKHFDFLTRTEKVIVPEVLNFTPGLASHGGADFGLMESFVKAVGENDPNNIKTGIHETLQSHLMVFAAEESRLTEKFVYLSNN